MKLKHMPLMMPWKGREIPHGAIEVNQKCNLSCDGCYKNKINFEKSIEKIKEEIDLMNSMRNLGSMTLTGGEPTLFEQLPELIRYISFKGIRPLVLTNGTNLDNSLLKKYKQEGLARISIHIDKHQNLRPDQDKKVNSEKELNPLRENYLDLCEKNGIATSLQATIYKDSLNEIFDIINFSQKRSQNHIGIFFTLYSPDVNFNMKTKNKMKNLEISNEEVIRLMFKREKALPTMYISSNLNKNSFRWIFYMNFASLDENRNVSKLYFHPRYKKLLSFLIKFQKRMKGRYSFDDPRSKIQNYMFLLLYSIYSFPRRDFINSFKFLLKSLINNNIKTFTTIFQEGPKRIREKEFEICRNCPDVTVRNKKIIPICIADFIEPIKNESNIN